VKPEFKSRVAAESLGFSPVYRYTAGKLDWFAMGLPMEGVPGGE
jgi:hypothetical protein